MFSPSIAILQISENLFIIFLEANAKIVTEERGLPDVVNAMSTHPNNADLIETAAAALLSLSMEGKWGRSSSLHTGKSELNAGAFTSPDFSNGPIRIILDL